MRLALEQIPIADLVLFVVDLSRPFDEEDLMIVKALSEARVILVGNKVDMALGTNSFLKNLTLSNQQGSPRIPGRALSS